MAQIELIRFIRCLHLLLLRNASLGRGWIATRRGRALLYRRVASATVRLSSVKRGQSPIWRSNISSLFYSGPVLLYRIRPADFQKGSKPNGGNSLGFLPVLLIVFVVCEFAYRRLP